MLCCNYYRNINGISVQLVIPLTLKVVNDGDMYMWRELGINSWPTFAVVSPNGKVIAQIAGEGHHKVTFLTPSYAFFFSLLPIDL